MIRMMTRRAVVLGPVLMALALAAQPVAASTPISDSGHQGPHLINDSSGTRGANCLYEGHKTYNKYLLDKISIRPPVVYSYDTGPGNQSQWVGWRYIIQRDTAPYGDGYGDLYKSTWVKDKADEAIPADFARRIWTASEDTQGQLPGLDRHQVVRVRQFHGHGREGRRGVELLPHHPGQRCRARSAHEQLLSGLQLIVAPSRA